MAQKSKICIINVGKWIGKIEIIYASVILIDTVIKVSLK